MGNDLLTPAHDALDTYRRNGRVGVSTRTVYMTPEVAAEWLRDCMFEGQRSLRRWHVQYLADAMRRGEFKPGAIELARVPGGKVGIIDGQHRLHAVVEAGTPQTFVVIEHEATDAEQAAALYARTDRGLGRSYADAASAYGLREETGLHPTHLKILMSAVGLIRTNFRPLSVPQDVRAKSVDERIRLAREWTPEAHRYFSALSGGQRRLIDRHARSAGVASVGLITFRYQEDRALPFWRRLFLNDALRPGDPRHTLLKFWGETNKRPTPEETARYVARAWNAYFENRDISHIKGITTTTPFILAGTPYRGE